MSNRKRFGIALAVLAGVTVSVLVGCNVLQYQFCITNNTSFNLKEVNIVLADTLSWGANQLSNEPLLPGQEQDIKGWAPGTYWVRAKFDVIDPCQNNFCETAPPKGLSLVSQSFQNVKCELNEVWVYSFDLPAITTTNLCIDYDEQQVNLSKPILLQFDCTEIYATAHFEI